MKKLLTDTLIIGGGIAGLYTALTLSNDRPITIVVKEKLGVSNSNLAQGGIAGEISASEEVLCRHISDTLIAGVGLYNIDAIKELVYEAKENLEYLIELGVPFDLDPEGNILLTQEGGHTSRRILHAGGDATGNEIMKILINYLRDRSNITIFSQYMLVDLLSDGSVCYGGRMVGVHGDIIEMYANHTIIATGGIGAVYKDSTNAHGATGDGIACAYRAGVEIRNMEFVQFHPTVFYDINNEVKGQKFLISEAVRGEGAYLRNIDGERFMGKYDPRLEMAPRDVVSQAITKEMYNTWSEYVFLDATHLDKDYLEKRFPTIYSKCLEHGYKMESDYIPVAPVEHYGIGGIAIDLNGHTSLKRLYANGECCNSGVHGANRLASNSLLECLVFGKRIAEEINETELKPIMIPSFPCEPQINKYSYRHIREEVRIAMSNYCFIVRTSEGLNLAKQIIDRHYINLTKYPYYTIDYYTTLNIVTVAKLIVEAALERTQSIGCHYRLD